MAILEIDNKVIELGENKLVFSKSGYSFSDWVTKDIPYSERITLPETSLLNSIFFRPYSPDINTSKFSKFHTFKYKEYGKIVSSGAVKLLLFNSNREYELQLLDSSFAIFEAMEANLNDLKLDSEDFTFNTTSYNSLKVLNSSVWLWPASSMHIDKIFSNNILAGNLAYSRPFFSIKMLVEKIFSENGWIYQLGVNADLFDKLIISANNEFLFTSFEKSFTTTITAGNINLSSPDFLKNDTVIVNSLTLSHNSKLRFRGNVVADNYFTLTFTVTGAKPQVQKFVINQGDNYYDLTTNEFTGGDTIVINLSGPGNISLNNVLIYTIIDENDFGSMSSANFVGYKVKTYDNIPNISQKDLFKNCLVKIGGFFSTENFRKRMTIHTLKSLSKLSAIDWSKKIIEDTEENEPLQGYGKINYFAYENSDAKPYNLGQGTFFIDNETLPNTEEIYRSIFAASQEVVIIDTMIDNDVYDNTSRIGEINTLIGYYENVSTYTVARFENLIGNNILANYYSNFIKAIQRGELTTLSFNLNKSDFFLFDFTKLVYLQQKKSIFYVIEINNYIENGPTELLLLKA